MDWKALLPYLLPVLTAIAGGGAATFTDVSGARAWRDSEAGRIAEAQRLEDRVKALEAQQEILLGLVGCRVPED